MNLKIQGGSMGSRIGPWPNHHSTINYNNNKNKRCQSCCLLPVLVLKSILLVGLTCLTLTIMAPQQADAGVLMRVCDTREIKTVTSRVCMLYKRTKHSDVKLDKHGNLRITRGAKGDNLPANLASECCKIGCAPHIFALNC